MVIALMQVALNVVALMFWTLMVKAFMVVDLRVVALMVVARVMQNLTFFKKSNRASCFFIPHGPLIS